MDFDIKNIEEKMDKTLNVLQENFAEVRAGRANPAILNKINGKSRKKIHNSKNR